MQTEFHALCRWLPETFRGASRLALLTAAEHSLSRKLTDAEYARLLKVYERKCRAAKSRCDWLALRHTGEAAYWLDRSGSLFVEQLHETKRAA